MLCSGSSDSGFKLNYQSIVPADQNAGCELAAFTCCVVELLYKLTAAHIRNTVYLQMSLRHGLRDGLLGVNGPCDIQRSSGRLFTLN